MSNSTTSQIPSSPTTDSVTPLQTAWTIWVTKAGKPEEYNQNLKLLTEIDSVEGFWLVQVDELKATNYEDRGVEEVSFFRKGRVPQFEHPSNAHVSRVVLQTKPKPIPFPIVDECALNAQLDLVGEQLLFSHCVCSLKIQCLHWKFRLEWWLDTKDTQKLDAFLADVSARYREVFEKYPAAIKYHKALVGEDPPKPATV